MSCRGYSVRMNLEEQKYLDLMQEIMDKGTYTPDRTGTGTFSIFGSKLEFELNGKLPLLTTKKMFTKGIIEELLFFLRGETNTKLLEEKGVNIWKGNTSREFLDSRGLHNEPEGSLGKGYGFQWRNFCGDVIGGTPGVDQLKEVIDNIKSDPYSRRHIVTAWNPKQINEMALPPCHTFWQFYIRDGKLSCQFYMRSVDVFLGLPFNIVSYALLTYLIAEMTGLQAEKVIFVGGDTHLYSNHIEQAKEQVTRQPFDFPSVIVPKADLDFKISHSDFTITNYQSHPAIKAIMAI